MPPLSLDGAEEMDLAIASVWFNFRALMGFYDSSLTELLNSYSVARLECSQEMVRFLVDDLHADIFVGWSKHSNSRYD